MKRAIEILAVLMTMALMGFMLSGCASEAKTQTVDIKVPSMVCDGCAETITTALQEVEGTVSVSVDKDVKIAKVMYQVGTTNLEALEMAISKAGYAANHVQADSVAYENLPKCCKIGGEEETEEKGAEI